MNGTVPIKTPDGQAELSTRARRLSQRHRTVLFLVDGKRSTVEVRSLAAKAGVPNSCFDELLDLGLIMVPPPTFSILIEDAPPVADTLHVDLPLSGLNSVSAIEDSVLPPSRSLQPESVSGELPLDEMPADSWYASLSDKPVAGHAASPTPPQVAPVSAKPAVLPPLRALPGAPLPRTPAAAPARPPQRAAASEAR